MYISTQGSSVENGPDVAINCPACGATRVLATSYNQIDRIRVVVVPVRWRTSWLICSACGRSLHCARDVSELSGLSADEVTSFVSPYVSFVSKWLAVLSVFLSWFPFVGLALAIVAAIANRSPGIWRKLSRVALALAVFVHVIIGIAMLLEK